MYGPLEKTLPCRSCEVVGRLRPRLGQLILNEQGHGIMTPLETCLAVASISCPFTTWLGGLFGFRLLGIGETTKAFHSEQAG